MTRVAIAVSIGLVAAFLGWTPAQAANCPPPTVGGKTVAIITLNGKQVPVKNITFKNGGVLDPPATNQAAGISVRNAKLSSRKGATVITWHVRYGTGCNGTLNPLITMPKHSTFTVGAVGKTPRTYEITDRVTIPKVALKRSWFSPKGPHRLVLFTCADLRGGVFHKTVAIFAKPVPTTPPAPSPTATTATTPTASAPTAG